MDADDSELLMPMYKSSNLEMRLFYVRIAPCPVESVPDHLTLRHITTETGVSLEINGHRLPSTSTALMINLRCDRIDKDLSEVTYVSTDSVSISGAVEFEVRVDDDELVLCGSLERLDSFDSDSRGGWSMDSYPAATLGSSGSRLRLSGGGCSPSIEVYIAGCCSGKAFILTKVIPVSLGPRRKVTRHKMLDAIPEDEELGKDQRPMNGLIVHHKMQISEANMDEYEHKRRIGNSLYNEDMYMVEEDGQLSWFNAGVRVGVGIGLGMCLGVGIGVGLLMRSYQATTSNFRRKFF